MSPHEVLCVANLSPFYLDPMRAVYTVHQRLNETDPAAFALAAPRIVAISPIRFNLIA